MPLTLVDSGCKRPPSDLEHPFTKSETFYEDSSFRRLVEEQCGEAYALELLGDAGDPPSLGRKEAILLLIESGFRATGNLPRPPDRLVGHDPLCAKLACEHLTGLPDRRLPFDPKAIIQYLVRACREERLSFDGLVLGIFDPPQGVDYLLKRLTESSSTDSLDILREAFQRYDFGKYQRVLNDALYARLTKRLHALLESENVPSTLNKLCHEVAIPLSPHNAQSFPAWLKTLTHPLLRYPSQPSLELSFLRNGGVCYDWGFMVVGLASWVSSWLRSNDPFPVASVEFVSDFGTRLNPSRITAGHEMVHAYKNAGNFSWRNFKFECVPAPFNMSNDYFSMSADEVAGHLWSLRARAVTLRKIEKRLKSALQSEVTPETLADCNESLVKLTGMILLDATPYAALECPARSHANFLQSFCLRTMSGFRLLKGLFAEDRESVDPVRQPPKFEVDKLQQPALYFAVRCKVDPKTSVSIKFAAYCSDDENPSLRCTISSTDKLIPGFSCDIPVGNNPSLRCLLNALRKPRKDSNDELPAEELCSAFSDVVHAILLPTINAGYFEVHGLVNRLTAVSSEGIPIYQRLKEIAHGDSVETNNAAAEELAGIARHLGRVLLRLPNPVRELGHGGISISSLQPT